MAGLRARVIPFVADPDFTLYCGDALEVLRELPAESVHTCVTSPPYLGLRDYGHREVGRSGGIVNGRPRNYEAERSIGSGSTIDWSPSCFCSAAHVTSAQSGHSPSQPSPNPEYDLPHVRQSSTGGSLPPVPCTVLDPFMGSGTTALVARRLGRKSVGIELNEDYARMCAARLGQQSLLATEGAA